MAEYSFETLDVFTTKRFGGNPLAVVFDTDGLTSEQMQTIAREFNLSETTFVSLPAQKDHRAKVRIFTPIQEMPFAGHPTLGTAIALARKDGVAGEAQLILELGVGPVGVKVTIDGAHSHAQLTAAKLPEEVVGVAPDDVFAKALSLDVSDIGFGQHQPHIFDVGPLFTFVPVSSLEAIGRAQINSAIYNETLAESVSPFLFLYTDDVEGDDIAFHARMFAPTAGVVEDPATGSAVTGFAGQLLASGEIADVTQSWNIEQGLEMGRPSELHLETEAMNGVLTSVRVAGAAISVSAGKIQV